MSFRTPILALALFATSGCGTDAFTCVSSAQCLADGVEGMCLEGGACAFPDDDCASGLRYGDLSPQSAGQCVETIPGTGTGAMGTDTGTTGSASTSDTGLATTVALDGTTTTGGPPSTDESGSTGEAIDPDLVVWFRFDPGADMFVDATSNALVADCAGETCPISGRERGLQLDGIDDMLTVASPVLDVPTPLTVTVWADVGTPMGTGWHLVVARPVGAASNNSWQIGLNSSGQWALGVGNTSAIEALTAPADPDGGWVFLALRHDGQQLRAWVDGVSIGEVAVPPVEYDDHPLLIGADSDADMIRNFWSGGVDDLRVYSRGLDDREVLDVMAERR